MHLLSVLYLVVHRGVDNYENALTVWNHGFTEMSF